MTDLKTDYLIIGSGAVGMAFADVLLDETDADIIIVDRHHKPGGHWNDAYSFVTLHQPSAFYGVSSAELSTGRKDEIGLNKGLHELASGAEVLGYFDQVMRRRLLPSGRVRYFPLSDYQDGTITSLMTGAEQTVTHRKVVDGTYFKTSVPSTHKPKFAVAEGVAFQPLNALPQLAGQYRDFTIVGGGKTAIDACLWLLEHQVDPDAIRWIRPRDGWMFDRANTQPSAEFFGQSVGAQAAQLEAIAAATSIDDLFERLDKAGVLVRIDQDVAPAMFHGATISQQELGALRRVKNVVRLGHVQAIEPDRIVLAEGSIPTSPDTLHIDCSARAVEGGAPVPVFQGDRIVVQTVRTVQPVFSAALIAYVEAHYETEKDKNRLTAVVPLPDVHTDWIPVTAAAMMNQFTWGQDKALRAWIADNRLDGFGKLVRDVAPDDEEKIAILMRMKAAAKPAMARLFGFMAELRKAA